MSEKPMNIYQKLIEVRKCVPYLQKEAKGHQYNYVSSSQVLAAVRQKLDEVGLILMPEVIGHNVIGDMVESTDKYNNIKHTTTYFTELDIKFMWVNADNPDETIALTWYGQGVDIAGEKGVGKALTYAEKYFLLKQFNIATDKDDPDSFQGKPSEPKPNNVNNSNSRVQRSQLANKGQRNAVGSMIKSLGLEGEKLNETLKGCGIKDSSNMTHEQAEKLIATLAHMKPEAVNA